MSHPIIHDLLRIEAVKIKTNDFFTWTSGLRSPIYCDNRLTMSYPEVRKRIASAFVDQIEALSTPVDLIAGCATAGIPHAAWVADQMNLPMAYVRSTPKKHGKGNQIEGAITNGQRAVVIEDLISTGKSSIEAAEALKASGVKVEAVISIFTYNLSVASQAFREHQLSVYSLASYDELVESLNEAGKLTKEEQELLSEWKHNPEIFTKS